MNEPIGQISKHELPSRKANFPLHVEILEKRQIGLSWLVMFGNVVVLSCVSKDSARPQITPKNNSSPLASKTSCLANLVVVLPTVL